MCSFSLVFIVLLEGGKKARNGNAECGEVARRSQGGRREVARRSQGGCKARAVIDFGPLGRYNIKDLQLYNGRATMEHGTLKL